MEISNKLKKGKKTKNENRLRALLEIAYSYSDKDNIDDRIYNLEKLVSLELQIPTNLRNNFEYNLAACYFLRNQLDKSSKIVPQTIKRILEDKSSIHILPHLYDLQASISLLEDKPAQAISFYKNAIEYSSNDAEYLYSIATIYFYDFFNAKLALDYCRTSFSKLSDEVENKNFFRKLILIYYRSAAFMKEFDEAFEIISQYNSHEDSKSFLADKAYIQCKRKEFKEAEKIATEVIADEPKNDTALNVMGMVNLAKKNYKTALNFFEAIIPSFEEEKEYTYSKYYLSEIYYNKAVCNLKLDNFEEAKLDMDKAELYGYDEINADILNELLLSNKIDKKPEALAVKSKKMIK